MLFRSGLPRTDPWVRLRPTDAGQRTDAGSSTRVDGLVDKVEVGMTQADELWEIGAAAVRAELERNRRLIASGAISVD